MKIIKQAGLLCLPILVILLAFPFVANEVPISSTTRENLLKLSSSRIDSPSQGEENNFGIDFYDSTLFESIKNHLKNFVSSSDLNIDKLFSGNGKNNLDKAIRFRSVIDQFQHDGFDLDIRLLPSQDMHHLMAAFTADGPFGRPAIFLNETYFTQSSFEWKQRVLLEEIGHYIDYELNETEDTAGDEGALFAAAVLGFAYDKSTAERLATQNDQIKIEIYEQIFSLELASLLFTSQQAFEIGALATLEQNSFTLTAVLGSPGSRYLFVSDPPSAEFFSGNNVRGRLYVVNASNEVDAEYFGEISRLVKTGSRVDALQFYVYPIAPPADRQTPGQTIIIPIVAPGLRTFSIGQTLGSSSDPVGPALNELLAVSQPVVVRATAKDAIESGGVANAILGTNPTGHIFTDGDITNPYTNYTLDTSVSPSLMVASSGGAMQVMNVTNSLGSTSAAGTPINGQYGSLTLNTNGSYTYTLDNTNPAVEALRTSSNKLVDQFTYRVADGTSFVVNNMVITIEGRNDNPVANDDYNVAKESLLPDSDPNQYESADLLGRIATGNILPNDTDVDQFGETKTVVNLVGSAAIQSKTINTTSADLTFVPGTTFSPVGSGDKAWFRFADNDWRALYAADKTTQIITTGGYNSTTRIIPLNTTPAFYYNLGSPDNLEPFTIVSGTTIIGFRDITSTTTTTNSGMKSGTVSSSETVGTTTLTPTLSSIKGTIAIGMTVTGTGVPVGTTITNVVYTGPDITSIVLSKAITSVDAAVLTFIGGSSQITGRHGTLILNANGSYVYTPFALNPNLNTGDSYIEKFYYVIIDASGGLSQTFPESSSTTRQEAVFSTEPGILYITVYGADVADPNAVNDTATAVEAGGTLNGTAGVNPTASAPGLLGNDTTPTGSNSITSAQSYGSGTPINVTVSTTIPGLYENLVLSSDGSYTYTVDNSKPEVEALRNSSQTLQEIFLYNISNGSGTDAATFTITIEGANDAPVAVNDFATAVEAGGFKNNIPGINPSGDLLANDTDVDDLASELVVTAIRTGNTEGAGTAGSVGSGSTLGTALAGLYGSLQVAADGSWVYTLDNTNAPVNALATGGTLIEYFNYTVNDRTNGAGTLSDTAVLTITIEGRDDEIRINSVFVNEGSPFAVFKVEGTAGIPIDLALGDNVPTGDDKATATADYGTSLQVWNGTSWVPYTAGVLIPAGDILYVRLAIVNDGIYEGNESFSLTAPSTGFVSATGIGTINDEGEGSYWIGDALEPATSAELTTAGITLDDDRVQSIIYADINTAFIGENRTGDVSTNDVMPSGTTYSALVGDGGNPSADFPVLATDGSYTFTTSMLGVYYFAFDVCAPGIVAPNCEVGTLEITVLAADATNAPPVANTDFAVGIQGTPVIVKTLANDDAGTAGAALDASTVSITAGTPNATTEGSLSVNSTTGDITFTPVAGFTGTVSYTYQVCDTNTPSACATATQTVTIYPTGSANILAAADDYNLTYQGTLVGGNVLTNDSQVKAGSLTATPQTTTVAGVGTFTLLADGSYTFVPVATFTGNSSFIYEVTGVDGVKAYATVYFSVAETPTFNWTGAGDPENWCDPDNWDKGTVPSTAVNVDIKYDATNPTVKLSGTCDLCIKNLDVQANATLEVDGIRLCVTGDVNSAGFIDGTGSIHLRGTTLQTISGDFNITNLELENAAGATITAGAGNMVQITESLKLTRGTLTTNSNLRLMSDASGDAYLAPISDAECALVNIIGSVRIQKFVDGGNRAFRFISHPFDGTISLQQIRDYVHITGEGLDFNLSGNPSAFWYHTAGGNQTEDGEDSGWLPVSSTNIGDWFKGRAVRMMFRGPRTQGGVIGDDDYNPSVVTYELIGEVNFCEQILTGLIRSGNPGDGTDTDKGDGLVGSSAFNFIGNPFPAAIDLKSIPLADRTNLSGAYYLWQPRTGVQAGNTVFGPGGGRGGNYVTEPFDGGIPALGQLASGTGFFVFALVNNATIRFTEANKLAQKKLAPGAAVTFREDWQQPSRYGTNSLQLSLTTHGHEADRVLLYFDEDAYAIVDSRDATKFANPAINFFTVSEDNYALAIDRRPWVDDNEYKIPLFILSPVGAEYILKIPDFNLEIGRKLFLVDRMNLSRTEIKAGMEYTFKVTDDPKSKGHRFDIVMGIEVITSLETVSNRFQAFLLPNPAQEQVRISIQRPDNLADTYIRLVSMTGVVVRNEKLVAETTELDINLNQLSKGIYLVEITHGSERIVKRLIVN